MASTAASLAIITPSTTPLVAGDIAEFEIKSLEALIYEAGVPMSIQYESSTYPYRAPLLFKSSGKVCLSTLTTLSWGICAIALLLKI